MKKLFLCFSILLTLSITLCACGTKNQEEPVAEPQPNPPPIEMVKDEDTEVVDNISEETTKFKLEYDEFNDEIPMEIPDEVQISYLTEDELKTFFETGTGIMYLGYPNCPWCRNALPTLMELSMKYDIPINYFNLKEIRTEENDTYKFLLQHLEGYLEQDADGTPKLYVPDVYFLKDGMVVGHNIGTVPEQEDPYVPLTEEQKKELTQIYEDCIIAMNE